MRAAAPLDAEDQFAIAKIVQVCKPLHPAFGKQRPRSDTTQLQACYSLCLQTTVGMPLFVSCPEAKADTVRLSPDA